MFRLHKSKKKSLNTKCFISSCYYYEYVKCCCKTNFYDLVIGLISNSSYKHLLSKQIKDKSRYLLAPC
jgi:hypothetical protein